MAAIPDLYSMIITQDMLNTMYGSPGSGGQFDVGLLPVFDPEAPTLGQQFVSGADVGGGPGGFLNIGPNALAFVEPTAAGAAMSPEEELAAWGDAGTRLLEAGFDYYKSLLGVRPGTPAAESTEVRQGYDRLRQVLESGQGAAAPITAMGGGRASPVSSAQYLKQMFGSRFAPEDIAPLELSGVDPEQLRQLSTGVLGQATAQIAYDAPPQFFDPLAAPGQDAMSFQAFAGQPLSGFYGGY